MKRPRFRIAWIMAIIAIAAVDIAVVRAVSDHLNPTLELLALGALPMANVLAFGMLAGFGGRDRRPFLLGFESFGALALAVYIVLACYFTMETIVPFISLFLNPLVPIVGLERSSAVMVVEYSAATVVLTLPQLAFALLGGLLSRRQPRSRSLAVDTLGREPGNLRACLPF